MSFASDAHAPEEILAGFAALRDDVEAAGFRAAPHDFGFWLGRGAFN